MEVELTIVLTINGRIGLNYKVILLWVWFDVAIEQGPSNMAALSGEIVCTVYRERLALDHHG